MNKYKGLVLKLTAVLLVTALTVLSACSGKNGGGEQESRAEETLSLTDTVYSDTTENVKKSETVYVNMDNTGSVVKITVSDWLHADRARVSVADRSDLSGIKVVKGAASSRGENGDVTWQLTTSDIYYQGTSVKELPVTFDVRYFLDGEEMSPEDIAGKSGKVRIEIKAVNNIRKTVYEADGEYDVYSPFIVAGGMILSYENFSSIEAENGIAVGAGSNELLVFEGMPGLAESLGTKSSSGSLLFNDTFIINAETENFALGDIYFAVLPLSSLDLDIELPESVKDAQDILDQIEAVASDLDRIDPDGVLAGYVTDASRFNEVFSQISTAVRLYRDNKELINAFTEVLTPENVEKLSGLMDTMNSEDVQRLTELLSDMSAFTSLISGLSEISGELSEVKPVLDELNEKLSDPTVAAQMEKLPETLEELKGLTEFLKENEDVINIIAELASSDSFTGLVDSLDKLDLGGAEDGSGISAETLVARMREWLSFDYGVYSDAPDYMDTSCMLIYKTAPLRQTAADID